MADPTDPTSPVLDTTVPDITGVGDASQKAADAILNMSNTVAQSQNAFSSMSTEMGKVGNIFSDLKSRLSAFGISLNEIKSLTSQQTEQFTLISAAVVGARQSFEGLNGVDSTGLNTFTKQLNDLVRIAKGEGPAATAATEAITNQLKKLGASDSTIAKATSAGITGLSALAQSMLTAADNGLRLQNAIIQMSANTGSLNDVFELAGPNLDNMNALLAKHEQLMSDTTTATGLSADQVQKYYAVLGSVPKALSSLVVGTGNSDKAINMLTATIKLATGTGRKLEDVTNDLKKAFDDYGLTGTEALKFSAQMSEVAGNLGIELDTVKSALQGTADTFKMFATNQRDATNMASGFAAILNNYAGALERTGFSGVQAVSVIKDMIGQVSNLNIAQKAFLSAQSGGPGGLMGGLQIEKMMRDDPAKVVEMVRNQMKKLSGGKITTEAEGLTSQGDAAKYEKQRALLQQGPLGALAKGPQEAARLISMFSELDKGKMTSKDLSNKIVQESIDKGTSIESKSYTAMTAIQGDVSKIRSIMDTGALGMVQKGMAAGTGTGEHGETSVIATNLRSKMKNATEMNNEDISSSLSMATQNKKLVDTTGRSAAAAISRALDTLSNDLPATVKQSLTVLKKTFTSTDTNFEANAAKAKEILLQNMARDKAASATLPANKQAENAAKIAEEQKAVNSIGAAVAAKKLYDLSTVSSRKVNPAGEQVGMAADRAVANKNTVPNPFTSTLGNNATPHGPKTSQSEITVHVDGFCLKCKQEIEGTSQAASLNPVANKT